MKEKSKKESRKKRIRIAKIVTLMVLWVGISVIASQLFVGYLMIFLLGREVFQGAVATAIYSALSYVLATVLVIYVPSKVIIKLKKEKDINETKIDREILGLKGWPTWTDIGLAPVAFIVSTLLAAGLVALFSFFPWFQAEETQNLGFSYYATGFDRIIAFVTLVIVAPIAEELIFRGWLYGKLREKTSETSSEITSIIISSLLVSVLFGFIHLQWNVAVNVFALSVVLCMLREVTGTIYAGILTHMVKNGIAFYLLYVLNI